MSVDVFLVSYNTQNLLEELFLTLANSDYHGKIRVLAVDNASSDQSLSYLQAKNTDVLLENKRNVGFGRANNQLLPYVAADYVLLLNTDAFVETDTLRATISFMDQRPECGILGVKLQGRDGELQPACRFFPNPWNLFLARTGLHRVFSGTVLVDQQMAPTDSISRCDWVPGCYYLIRRKVIDDIGLFDPRFFMYFEEVDHCRRAKAAGWEVVYYPFSSVVHLGGESAKTTGDVSTHGKQLSDLQIESELLYMRKHFGRAGLFLHVLLYYIGSLIQLLKGAIRFRPATFFRTTINNAFKVLKTLIVTHLASRPTR